MDLTEWLILKNMQRLFQDVWATVKMSFYEYTENINIQIDEAIEGSHYQWTNTID